MSDYDPPSVGAPPGKKAGADPSLPLLPATKGQYNINSNAPPYKYGNFSSRDFCGFGVVASKENADLARRRRIWRLFSATKSTTKNRERDLVLCCRGWDRRGLMNVHNNAKL